MSIDHTWDGHHDGLGCLAHQPSEMASLRIERGQVLAGQMTSFRALNERHNKSLESTAGQPSGRAAWVQ